jgi:hypothetical protein
MCERPSERLNYIFRFTVLVSLVSSVAIIAAAQGGDGRSESARRLSAANDFVKRSKPPASRNIYRRVETPPKPAIPKTARLAIVVNEGASRVYLTNAGLTAAEPIAETSRPQSLIVRPVDPGRYTLVVKKPGFFDEVRSIDLGPGAKRKVVISLRPQMALLTLKANLADAEIDIENVGKFTKPLKKYFLKPGKYRITLKRRGFEPQTVTADLKTAGKEQNIYVVLKPIRIDSMLAQATQRFENGDIAGASELVKDVLLMNSAHAKANLLYGMIELRRGSQSSSTYFLKAIRGGETVSIPVRTLFGNQLADIQIALNRDAIIFQSRSHLDLNFRITRPKLADLRRLIDGNFMSYIAVKGESDFYGRGIHPDIMIFSGASEIDQNSKHVFCRGLTAGRSCSEDIDILFNIISEWRDLRTASAKGADR